VPVSWVPRETSTMFDETSWVPDAARWTFSAISRVAAPCSSTAEAMAVAVSEMSPMTLPMAWIDSTASQISAWMAAI
jgi:hypothetical protein